jgi:hypothetical protein
MCLKGPCCNVGPLLVDINNDNRGQGIASVYSNAYQSFTPSRNGSLVSFELFTGEPYYGFTMTVIVTSGDARTGTTLGSASLYVRSAKGQYYNFTFEPPIPMTAGKLYSFGMNCVGVEGCFVGSTKTNMYPGGMYCTRRCSGGFNEDAAFRTYMVTANSCQFNNGDCNGNSTCVSTGHCINTCTCPSGYNYTGSTCAPINQCLSSNGRCDVNAVCVYTGPGTRSCTCKSGFFSTNGGLNCTAWKVCLEQVAPTATSDRVCMTLAAFCEARTG